MNVKRSTRKNTVVVRVVIIGWDILPTREALQAGRRIAKTEPPGRQPGGKRIGQIRPDEGRLEAKLSGVVLFCG
jgi:hypothetical protein